MTMRGPIRLCDRIWICPQCHEDILHGESVFMDEEECSTDYIHAACANAYIRAADDEERGECP
jgi:hypothetical protein